MKVRDLLPVNAVRCHLTGTLVPYFGRCKGETNKTKRHCDYWTEEYVCSYLRNMGIGVEGRELSRLSNPLERRLER